VKIVKLEKNLFRSNLFYEYIAHCHHILHTWVSVGIWREELNITAEEWRPDGEFTNEGLR